MSSQIHVAALSNVGRVRSNNEDAFAINEANGLYIVCDGMGGAAAGEVASHLAATTTIESFAAQSLHTSSSTDLEAQLRSAIVAANSVVYRGGRGEQHHHMGTTLVAAAIAGNTLVIANVGDSRAYILQGGIATYLGWRQVTHDHSYINELVQKGTIRAEDTHAPELQRFSSIITRAIGAAETVEPEFFHFELNDGDTVLLCSDGLTRYLDAPEFDDLIDPVDLENSCRRLIDRANELGGIDNITSLLVRYTEQQLAEIT